MLVDFLSCLYGSEQTTLSGSKTCSFLSCLYGSELLSFQIYALSCKRLSLFWQKYPLFLMDNSVI
ncbi:hypothetical protein, partial [Rahnella sp. AN3-3W3]|uniref:hypothetical protein n=1 Tax=Rahnella sp. AN3-3W3 TaxID=1610578 RepID=UPI001E340635